jgi:hypothetical protein
MYKYRLNEEVGRAAKYQEDRINAFDNIEKQLVDVVKAVRKAKIDTIAYYRDNPDKFAVVYGTDLIQDYLNDIKTLLSQTDNDE